MQLEIEVPPQEHQHLDPELLSPDRVLDIAYCVFVASTSGKDPGVALDSDSDVLLIARRVVKDFHRLCEEAPYGSEDRAFLFTIQQVITSLSRGIIRRKHYYEQQMQMAEEKKTRQIQRLTTQSNQAGIFKAAYRGLLLGGLGYALVRLFYPDLHLDNQHEQSFASLASAITFVLLGTFLRSFNLNRSIIRIFADYDHEQLHANIVYQQSALEEYLRAEEAACRAWQKYTGEKPLNLPGFERVLADELRRNRAMEKQRRDLARSPFSKTLRFVGRFGIRRKPTPAEAE